MKLFKVIVLSFLIALPDIVQARTIEKSENLESFPDDHEKSATKIVEEVLEGVEDFFPELILIDQIDCVVCGSAYNKPFTNTDTSWKRTLENQFIPIAKQIQADIVMQQVLTDKMPLDPEATGKYVESLKKQLKINDAELETLFSEVGRTMLEGIELLNTLYTSEFFTHYRFKSQLVPTDDEIEAYFNDFPEFIDGFYELQIARITCDEQDHDAIKKQIEKFALDGQDVNNLIAWGNVIKIAADDLSDDQQFIKDMKVDDIKVQESEGMFELVKVITSEPTRIKTLDERRSYIIDILNRKKLDNLLQAYNESVKDLVDIITFQDQDSVLG